MRESGTKCSPPAPSPPTATELPRCESSCCMCVCDDAAARPPDGNACRTQCEGLVENDNCYMHGVVGSGTYRQTMGREASPHAAAKA
eukprot:7339302-Pyramimonas_sp.AAC.1